jgi:histidinol dehydrogenase
MMKWQTYTIEEADNSILKRRSFRDYVVSPGIQKSLDAMFGEGTSPADAVQQIIERVRAEGDAALFDLNARIDRAELETLRVSQDEIDAAVKATPDDVYEALVLAYERITDFHENQPSTSWINTNDDGILGQMVLPLDSVGVYVPGGSAPLPSSLLMCVVPAQVAGVKKIVLCAPPNPSGGIPDVTLAAAAVAGTTEIYKVGGAQAVAAMAYGTESVPRVAKIVGAGNIFVTLAKQQVFGDAGIDGLPGPTETMVIADEHADPALAAADLLAQAEHDPLASAILVTPSQTLADAVADEIMAQLETLSRREIIDQAMQNNSGTVIVSDLDEAFDVANDYAAEHLCLLVENPWDWSRKVRNAGGIFLGEHSFEVLGDYVAGPSHIMPTGGTARFASPLNVNDFVKITSIIALEQQSASRLSESARLLAEVESLTAHANAAARRVTGENDA